MTTLLLLLIGIPLALALLVLVLPYRWAGYVALLGPLSAILIGIPLWSAAIEGEAVLVPIQWFPSLGITASMRVDHLGAFFVLLVGLIGLGIFQYARHYLGSKATPGFWASLLAFTGGMLGIVVSDSLLLLFVFWELTTITSALLIGMDFDKEEGRRGAVQAFLVTGAGGLALLGGIVLVAQIGGSWELSGLEAASADILAHPWHLAAMGLILLGAFTKSAQFPFHFWLPGAMAAPAPVSAYLHSATMVKAGVFLLGRFLPVFGDSEWWFPVLATIGLTTFFVAGWNAVRAYDVKQVLAHSTVAYLGVLTAMYGYYGVLDNRGELLNIANHAMYKSSLFLLLGWLEKAAGTRDLAVLEDERWLSRAPVPAALFTLGALAMAGLPFLLGFMSKEVLFHAIAGGKIEGLSVALVVATLAGVLAVIYALKISASVFLGSKEPPTDRGKPLADISPWLLVVPAAILTPQLIGGVLPGWFLGGVLEPDTAGAWPDGPAIWQNLDVKLALSLAMLVSGALLWKRWRAIAALPGPLSAERGGALVATGTLRVSSWFSYRVQEGGHPWYVSVLLLTALAVMGGGLLWAPDPVRLPVWAWRWEQGVAWVPVLAVAAGAVMALTQPGRIPKIVFVAVVGYGMAIFYVLFRAPDLALTQLLVETISLILLLLVFRLLPTLKADRRAVPTKVFHGLVAAATGVAMGLLTWTVGRVPAPDPAGEVHLLVSAPEAKGYNVVNVILVDFRGLDTLGEVAVLAIAALGAIALFHAGRRRGAGEGSP